MRRVPWWPQSEGGPLAHAAGASVVPKRRRPPCPRAGGPKAKEAPSPMRWGPRWSQSEGGKPSKCMWIDVYCTKYMRVAQFNNAIAITFASH